MADQQGLINVARGDAQATADKADEWGPSSKQAASIAQDQAASDRMSSPNHRLNVLKAHPSTRGITRVAALPTDTP